MLLAPFRALGAAYERLIACFALPDAEEERCRFGLGQFVLLLTLTPFAINLSLYSFGAADEVTSFYEHRAERFPHLMPMAPLPALPDAAARQVERVWDCMQTRRQLSNVWSSPSAMCVQEGFSAGTVAQDAALSSYYAALSRRFQARHSLQERPAPLPDPPDTLTEKRPAELLPQWVSQAANVYYVLLGLGLVLYGPVVWRCVRQRAWGLLVFGLCIPTYFLAAIAFLILGWDISSPWCLVVLPKIAFLWFVLRGRMVSAAFAVYMVLLIAACVFNGLAGPDGLLLSALPVALFVLAAGTGRLLVRGTVENAYILRNLGWRSSLRLAGKATLYWVPMALLAVPYFVMTQIVIPRAAVNALHAQRVPISPFINKTERALVSPLGIETLRVPTSPPDAGTQPVLVEAYHADVRDNALKSAAAWADAVAYQFHLAIELTQREVSDQAQQLRTRGIEPRVMERFDLTLPATLRFGPVDPDVGIFKGIVTQGIELAQGSVNDAYVGLRTHMRASVRTAALEADEGFRDQVVDPTEAQLLSAMEKIRTRELQTIRAANREAQESLWWAFGYWHAAHQLALLLFAVVCVKSWLYVFARVALHAQEGTFLTLGDPHAAAQAGEAAAATALQRITATGGRYVIPGDSSQMFYISRRFQCRGKAPRFAVPQPLGAPIARLLHGATAMNQVVMQAGDGPVSCTATQGAEFLEWQLAEGEVVVFDFHHFVGMSSTVRISTLISPRISTLLLGKFIFSTATGPGKLILMTKGRAEITGTQDAGGSLPPERLVAMHRDTRLYLDSEHRLVDVYLSAAYVRPAAGAPVIVDVDVQSGAASGLGRFLRNFLWPV